MAVLQHNLAPARRGSPNVAALLSWFLPGAGHLYLGQASLGVLLLVVVNGMFFVGLQLADGMTFEYLDPELRSAFAPILSPEIGNLGGLLYQMKTYGFGPGYLRPWPDHIVLGSMLTAASGVANALVMAHAHTLARTKTTADATRPMLPTLAAWLVPGLGHVLQGRRLRGVIVFVLLVGLFALGTALAEASNLSRERHFYYWAGQSLLGLPALLSEALFGDMRITHDIAYVEAGLVLGCVAGLLNVVAMLDVYGWGEAKLFGWPVKSSSHETPPAAAKPPAGTTHGRAPKEGPA